MKLSRNDKYFKWNYPIFSSFFVVYYIIEKEVSENYYLNKIKKLKIAYLLIWELKKNKSLFFISLVLIFVLSFVLKLNISKN